MADTSTKAKVIVQNTIVTFHVNAFHQVFIFLAKTEAQSDKGIEIEDITTIL